MSATSSSSNAAVERDDRAAGGGPSACSRRSSFTRSPSSWTSCSRSRSASSRSVTSRLMPTMRTGRPSALRIVCADAADRANRAVRPPHPEVGPELAIATQRGLDVAGGARQVFRHEAPRPRVEGAAEFLLANAIEPVHRVVPHQAILLHVPVPDTEPGRVDGELQPVFAHAQARPRSLPVRARDVFRVSTSPTRSSNDVLSLAAMSLNDCARPSSSSSLLPGTRALRSPARHGLRRARDPPERRGHHRRQCRGQHEGEHQRQRQRPSPNGCCRRAAPAR